MSDETSLIPAEERPYEALIHAQFGDLDVCADAMLIQRGIVSALDIFGKASHGGATPRSATNITGIEIALRAAAVAALPMLRKFVREHYPHAPLPQPPRGSDPARYLVSYVAALALHEIQRRRWTVEFVERPDGSVQVLGAHEAPAAVFDATVTEDVTDAQSVDSAQPDTSHGAA